MRICLPGSADPFERAERERALFAQRQQYTWVHAPGQPPYCKDLPAAEQFSEEDARWMALDMMESVADIVLAVVERLFKHNDTVASFKRYYPIRSIPAVAGRWMQDEEFARQRLDGINPLLLKLATEIPAHFAVSDETVRGLIPAQASLASLLAERRLFLLDYEILHGLQPVYGRFCVAPIALFWLDDRRRLMPLAIQLGQSPAEAGTVFTPKDEHWTWLLARSYLQSADGTYHEVVSHLTRTHLAMETFWVAACRSLPPQHPVHELLKPHFTDTLAINKAARTKLLATGGPIDESIAIGAEGCLTLIGIAHARWRFDHNDPLTDFESRGLLDPQLLPSYHFRDDALLLFEAIKAYVHDLLALYYPDDQTVQQDTELQTWARELVGAEGGRVQGLPFDGGAVPGFAALHAVVAQLIFTCSVEHAAVNNGQYAQFGWIPNTPGAMYLPPPRDHAARNEANFVYALPDAKAVGEQLTLVHLLSERTTRPLGKYPESFFQHDPAARLAVDRFRARLDDIGRAVQARNQGLEVPYVYLTPWRVARSIAI